MPRPTDEKLDNSINVPVPTSLKARVIRLAQREPNSPALTKFTRTLIVEGIERREKKQTATAGR